MRPETEKSIEKYLAKKVEEAGGRSYKFTSPGNVGVPDRLVVMDRRVFFIEVKGPTGRLTKRQEQEMTRLADLGVPTGVVSSKAMVDDWIAFAQARGRRLKTYTPKTSTPETPTAPKRRGRPPKVKAETYLQ